MVFGVELKTDCFRVEAIQTPEEFKDVNTHFLLYYSADVVDLQNMAKASATLDGKVFKPLISGPLSVILFHTIFSISHD